MYGILAETERRGITFDQLLTIPEQDEWVYSDGKSTTCVAFILAMYKAAGVFGPVSNSIQVTEFTVSNSSMVSNTWTIYLFHMFLQVLLLPLSDKGRLHA